MSASALPPGPSRPALAQTWDWVRRPTELLDDCAARFGKRFTLRFIGGRDYVLLSDPADVKAVFTAPPDSFISANRAMRDFVGPHSLFLLEGDRHRRHRRLIGPPLRGERLRAFADLMRALVEENLRQWPLGKPFAVVTRMRDITLQVIFRAIFGVEDDARAARLTRLVGELTDGASAMLAFLRPLQVDLGPLSPWGRFLRKRRELEALLRMEVERARAGHRGREDILARLLDEGAGAADPLSDDEIVDELLTLLAAGHETSTATLAWAFQWILGDLAVRDRVVEEVRAAPLDAERLEQLPYLEAAVDETLRLSPIIPLVPRLLATELQLADLPLPAGTYVAPCPYLTQRDPDLFEEPLRFRPERALGRRVSPFTSFPFGGGHRHCIGAAFAAYEVKVILATVLARADLHRQSVEPQRIRRHGITLTPERGTPVVVDRWIG